MKTCLAVGTALALFAASSCHSAQARYRLDVRSLSKERDDTILSLREAKSNRLLWSRQFYHRLRITWSRNKKALAVEDVGTFFVWRENKPLQSFRLPRRVDYSMGCVWSPDNRRLLARGGVSAMSDLNIGNLYCLTFGARGAHKWTFVSYDVRRMAWRDNRTALYWVQANDLTDFRIEKTPRVWCAR